MATGGLNLGISALEDYIVRHAKLYISSLILAAAIAAPTAIMAFPRPQDRSVQERIYERDHRDYHNWDDHEDRAIGVTSQNSTGVIASTTSSTTERRGTTGIGATVIRTTINKAR